MFGGDRFLFFAVCIRRLELTHWSRMSLQAAFRTRKFSVDDVGFFEGTEKLLEVWFEFSSSESDATRGLRAIPKLVKILYALSKLTM